MTDPVKREARRLLSDAAKEYPPSMSYERFLGDVDFRARCRKTDAEAGAISGLPAKRRLIVIGAALLLSRYVRFCRFVKGGENAKL